MESLAFVVFLLWSSLFLGGPFAYLLARYRWNWAALLLAAASIWLGVFWFATIYTYWKYLGIASAIFGLLALLRVAENFYDKLSSGRHSPVSRNTSK